MTMPTSALYDVLGPRARRTTLIASVLAAIVVIAGLYLFVYRPLDEKGQFSMELWGPLIDPSNELFPLVWRRLASGLRNTLIAAALAILTSLVFGILLAILRVQLKAVVKRRYSGFAAPAAYGLRALNRVLAVITRFCVEIFRGLPVVLTIFFVFRGLPEFGISFANPLWYLVIGLTIYNMVVVAEILRSGMEGLPTGQAEAAAAIGLSPFQTTRIILLPQALRIMLPALISQLVVILKDTSLGFIISYEDLLNVSKQIIGVLGNPIQTYFVVGLIYMVINYMLSKLARYVHYRLGRARKTAALPTIEGPAAETEPSVEIAGRP
jgi:glutamate transport system permease protein